MKPAIYWGRQVVTIGAAPNATIVMPGMRDVDAEIVHQGNGRLVFVPAFGSIWEADGRALAPGQPVPFDFRTQLTSRGVALDNLHPSIPGLLMSRGGLDFEGAELVVGRDPQRCHVVIVSPGVSGRHLTFTFPNATDIRVIDHHSTSGTWLHGERLPPEQEHAVAPLDILSIGPVPVRADSLRALYESDLLHQTKSGAAPTQELEARPRVEPSAASSRHRTVVGTMKLVAMRDHKVGRNSDNDVVLDYPQISGHHATLLTIGGHLYVEDAQSELGTRVRGARLKPGQRVPIENGEAIQLGPLNAQVLIEGDELRIAIEDDEDWAGRPTFEIEADNLSVQVKDRLQPNRNKVLVDRLSFKALPGDLIALMGPSGSGKTTVLHMLTGYLAPTSGQVRVNGQPLPQVFDSLRGCIGYVPQDDIIHPELTVREAVTYSAKLRLPADYSPQEIEARVQATLLELGLEGVAHLQIGKPEAKVLSGGQRKRVNIAIELVTDPILLFLDEPTSGLAADDTAQLVALLEGMAKRSGKTIVATIHQPARDEYERFNLALVLGPGGVPLYFGPTKAAYAFFEGWRPPRERPGVNNPRDMFAELTERQSRLLSKQKGTPDEVRQLVSAAFRKDYEASALAAEMQTNRRALGANNGAVTTISRRPTGLGRQLRLLTSRYLRIKSRDRVGSAILLLQAPIIALLLGLVFGSQKPAPIAWCYGALDQIRRQSGDSFGTDTNTLPELAATTDRSAALFFLVVSAIWFGTSNAAREIVAERAIYRRERMVHLNALNFALSKFFVLAGLCVLQCSLLLGIVWFMLNLGGGPNAFMIELGMLTLTAWSGVALGLLVSALVSSTEAAMALTPIALIPQVVLGGLMVPVTTVPWLGYPMALTPARWGFEGVIRPERWAEQSSPAWNIHLGDEARSSLPDFIDAGVFRCALAQLQSTELVGAWGFSVSLPWLPVSILGTMTLVLLAAVVVRQARLKN